MRIGQTKLNSTFFKLDEIEVLLILCITLLFEICNIIFSVTYTA